MRKRLLFIAGGGVALLGLAIAAVVAVWLLRSDDPNLLTSAPTITAGTATPAASATAAPAGVTPAAVVLEVAQTDPWVRGDTAQGGTKPARLETGLTVNVPLFVNTGDRIKVDTRSGQYLERA